MSESVLSEFNIYNFGSKKIMIPKGKTCINCEFALGFHNDGVLSNTVECYQSEPVKRDINHSCAEYRVRDSKFLVINEE